MNCEFLLPQCENAEVWLVGLLSCVSFGISIPHQRCHCRHTVSRVKLLKHAGGYCRIALPRIEDGVELKGNRPADRQAGRMCKYTHIGKEAEPVVPSPAPQHGFIILSAAEVLTREMGPSGHAGC